MATKIIADFLNMEERLMEDTSVTLQNYTKTRYPILKPLVTPYSPLTTPINGHFRAKRFYR